MYLKRWGIVYNKYLKVLGLNKNFTEKELKNAYKNLAKKFHPDNFNNASEIEQLRAKEKMQEINEAYDELNKRFKKTTTDFDLEYYRGKVREEMLHFLDGFEDYEEEFPSFKSNKKIMYGFVNDLIRANDRRTLETSLHIFNIVFRNFLDLMQAHYFVEYFIDPCYAKELDYNCSIREFYKQLEKCKYKYSRSFNLDNLLNEVVNGYKLYTYYGVLKSQIEKLRAETIEKVRFANYRNVEESKTSFNNDVKTMFKKYDETIGRVNSVLKLCSDMYGIDVFDKAREDRESYKFVSDILDIEDILIKGDYKEANRRLDMISELIDVYTKNYRIESINDLFLEVVSKYNQVCVSLSNKNDSINLFKANCIYQIFLEVYFKYIDGELNKEDLEVLRYFTFVDYDEEKRVINKILDKSNLVVNVLKK